MSRRIGARKERVPYLTDRAIEEHADLLLAEWEAREGGIEIPVPLDDLVEMHLGIRYVIDDLRDELSIPDVLGAIWFSTGKIVVDSSLDPHVNPSMLGRFNFTLAHEIGSIFGTTQLRRCCSRRTRSQRSCAAPARSRARSGKRTRSPVAC